MRIVSAAAALLLALGIRPAGAGEQWVAPTLGARFGAPLSLSASAGAFVGRAHTGEGECGAARGVLVQLEGGIGGGRVSLGPGFSYCYTPFGSLAAVALKGSLVRTWGRPLGVAAGQTYLGGQLDFGVVDWTVGFGLLKRVSGDRESPNLLFTWGLGRGF